MPIIIAIYVNLTAPESISTDDATLDSYRTAPRDMNTSERGVDQVFAQGTALFYYFSGEVDDRYQWN